MVYLETVLFACKNEMKWFKSMEKPTYACCIIWDRNKGCATFRTWKIESSEKCQFSTLRCICVWQKKNLTILLVEYYYLLAFCVVWKELLRINWLYEVFWCVSHWLAWTFSQNVVFLYNDRLHTIQFATVKTIKKPIHKRKCSIYEN